MSEYFSEPKSSGERVKVDLDWSSYPTKANLTDVDTPKFAKKIDLASLKSKVDKLQKVPIGLKSLKSKLNKLEVDTLVPVTVNLSKLSDVLKNDFVKKDVYNAKIKNNDDKVPDIVILATDTNFNAKIDEAKNQIPSITNLATTTALMLK